MTSYPCSCRVSDGVLNLGLYLLVGGRELVDVLDRLGRRDVDITIAICDCVFA